MSIVYAREMALSADEYIAVLSDTTMRTKRPLENPARIQEMLDGANFVVTARDEAGTLVGLARCICDFAWICYCAELAVKESHQGLGIGKRLLDTAAEILGPRIGITLNAEPEAVGFYRRMGMDQYPAFFRPRSDRS